MLVIVFIVLQTFYSKICNASILCIYSLNGRIDMTVSLEMYIHFITENVYITRFSYQGFILEMNNNHYNRSNLSTSTAQIPLPQTKVIAFSLSRCGVNG